MTVIGQGFRACSNFKTLNRVGLGSRHARPGRLIRTMSTGHLERTAAEPRNKELHEVTISRIDQINANVRLFRLALPAGPVKFSAGQWLDTFVPGVSRAGGFTITSAPSAASEAQPYLELAVQASPENAPAAWLWRPTEEILRSTLQVRIGGSFVFPPADVPAADVRKVVLVAGGVGVNPLMSMLSCLSESDEWKDVNLNVLYASKGPREGLQGILFLERIAKLFGEDKLRGQVSLHVTGGESSIQEGMQMVHGTAMDVRRGRILPEELAGVVQGEHRDATLVYVCGPPGMTDEFVELLTNPKGVGLSPRLVKTEKWW